MGSVDYRLPDYTASICGAFVNGTVVAALTEIAFVYLKMYVMLPVYDRNMM